MSMSLSPNTQAILLLTAPLIAGRNEPSADVLTPVEYKRLARFLREKQQQPADLLAPDARALLGECQQLIDSDRLKRLLGRGFLLQPGARALADAGDVGSEPRRRRVSETMEGSPQGRCPTDSVRLWAGDDSGYGWIGRSRFAACG